MEFKRIVVKVTENLKVVCNSYPGALGSKNVLLFSHATGFCKETWNGVVTELRNLGNKDDILLVDQRNHGDSVLENIASLPKAPPPFDWIHNGRDLVQVVKTLYPNTQKKIIGIGHSGGAASIFLGHLEHPEVFDSIVAVESVYPDPSEHNSLNLAEITKKRKANFPSKQAAFTSFVSKPAFAEFTEKSLWDYVNYGFRDVDPAVGDTFASGVVLKCPPVHEASVFEGGVLSNLLSALPGVKCPTLNLNGELSMFISKISLAKAKSRISGGVWKTIPGAGHFVVMQFPEVVAKEIFDWAQRPNPSAKL